MKFTYEYLKEFTIKAFMEMGYNKENSDDIAEVFLSAELRGISSHGMIRLKDYFQMWQAGRINGKPDIKVIHETPSTAVVDGDKAVGMVPATFSMRKAIEKAKTAGTGWVACRNSNHYGIAGYYSMMALEHDMIGVCMTNANPLVAPALSVSRFLGTNPIAVAVPAKNENPFVADFATTPIARGKLAVAEKQGKEVPEGYVQDKEGNSTTNPAILKQKGSMLGLGGDYEHGSHKGYCLGAIVDIFSGVFSGANFGPFVPPSVAYLPVLDEKVGEGIGHFFGAMRIDAWSSKEDFLERMDEWIKIFRKAQPAKGYEQVLIPGDIEREKEKKNRQNGIEIIPGVVEDLKIVSSELNIDFVVNNAG